MLHIFLYLSQFQGKIAPFFEAEQAIRGTEINFASKTWHEP
jgi:hypothetical protein